MTYELIAELREDQGTGASRRLRREGKVPAILYGDDFDPIALALDHKTIFYALDKSDFHTSILQLNVNGTTHDVILRDFQFHPYKKQVLHLDLQKITRNVPVKIRVPVVLENAEISPAVKLQGGRVSLLNSTVEIIALPDQIPAALPLDVREATAGQILHLSDLKLPEGVVSTAAKRGENPPIARATGKKR